jgi:protein TonB
MEINKILQADYLDLIFDNRNKNYGSYELRKRYKSRAIKAFGIMITLVSLGVAVPTAIGKIFPNEASANLYTTPNHPTVISDPKIYDIKPKIVPPTPKKIERPTPSVKATIATAPPKIVANTNVPPAIAPPKMPLDAEPGAVTNPGNGGKEMATTTAIPVGKSVEGVDPGKGKIVDPGESGKPVFAPDVMPEYPGGMAGLQKYLQSNLKYPAQAREDGIEGRVIVKFVVNEQGRVEGATIIKGLGGGCDKEALRVVNAMKGWKPGMVQGKAVKVYYTLPIAFRME